MITAKDAIAVGRSLLGTPYSELDCINFIKKIIRTAPGGDPKYTTAGTATLWASIHKSGKYQDLVMEQFTLDDPVAGMLAFKGEPLGKDGQPKHVGLVTGEGTVLHSSSVKGQVIESPLTKKENWSLLAVHRLIDIYEHIKEETLVDEILYLAEPNDLVEDDSWLNLRAQPSVTSKRLAKIRKGDTVAVLQEVNDKWVKVSYTSERFLTEGVEGYCYSKYLDKLEPIQTVSECIVIEDSMGNVFYPVGNFTVSMRVVED